jgi:hypothetical protein
MLTAQRCDCQLAANESVRSPYHLPEVADRKRTVMLLATPVCEPSQPVFNRVLLSMPQKDSPR